MKNKMENLKLNIAVGANNPIEIETNVLLQKTGKYYYIPTEYKEPLRCKLIDYNCNLGIQNIIRIMAVISIKKGNKIILKEIQPELLFKTKSKASDFYLKHKELNLTYLGGE